MSLMIKAGSQSEKLYLDPFLDLWNREVLSYGVSERPSANSIMTALGEAIDATSDCKYRRTFTPIIGLGIPNERL